MPMASANLSFKYKKNKRAVQQISSLTPLTELEKFAKYPPTGPKRCLRGYRTLHICSFMDDSMQPSVPHVFQ
jgi:hypothetical protein